MESLGYVLVYLAKGVLPWQNLKAGTKKDKYERIMEKKLSTPVEGLYKGLPAEFCTYINYCKQLRFEDKPDYTYLRTLFKDFFTKSGWDYDWMYDWTPGASAINSKPRKEESIEDAPVAVEIMKHPEVKALEQKQAAAAPRLVKTQSNQTPNNAVGQINEKSANPLISKSQTQILKGPVEEAKRFQNGTTGNFKREDQVIAEKVKPTSAAVGGAAAVAGVGASGLKKPTTLPKQKTGLDQKNQNGTNPNLMKASQNSQQFNGPKIVVNKPTK